MEKVKTSRKINQPQLMNGAHGEASNGVKAKSRLAVQKTYKLYIDGKFPRSESGRYFKLTGNGNQVIANVCRGSKKDFRDAVVAARKAQEAWASRSAYLKGQILYRIAETLEGRKLQFAETLMLQGAGRRSAATEVETAIDRLVHYAGWADKYQQVFSSVNPVESSHFNFSFPEPTGVVSAFAPVTNGLTGLVSVIAPVIVGGNTMVVLADEKFPLTAIEFAEVMHASDLPGGVVNILTGFRKELIVPFSSHMDVNAMVYCGSDSGELTTIRTHAALNVKRVIPYKFEDWLPEELQCPYMIMETQEIKTTWHPKGI